ncbi:MAG TPA: DUF1583 domain-containing protein, partial [Schlesneria sp.]
DPPEWSDHYNRIKLAVTPEKIQYTVNGHLIHTEPYSTTTSPWFFLQCDRVWQTCFRNIQITGNPEVPSEVLLSQGESLLGWCSDFYGEMQPPRTPPVNAAADDREYDWWSKDGMIHGRLTPSNGYGKAPVQQSRLYYGRPLLDGDRLRYEFWYEHGAGGTHVHPAFDRLAILLDPDGLKLHWMTDGSNPEDAYGGLAPDHTLIDASIRRDPVKLNDHAWNQAEISLTDDIVTVRVNGSTVCERPLEVENSRQFGFYHDKYATAVKVRNVSLTGNWPKTLTKATLSDLLAPAHDRNDVDRSMFGRVIEEKFRATDLDGILLQTRSMPPAERYQALKKWVLPNVDHEAFRLYADNAPADPLPVTPIVLSPVGQSSSKPAAKGTGRTTRVRSGGELIGPALDLVAVAKELGKLDELRDLTRKIPPASEQLRRSSLAMQVLIAISAEDLKQAAVLLKELTPPRDKGLPDSLSVTERWPELVAAWEASYVPELCTASNDLLDLVLDSTNRKGVGTPWDIKVRSAKQYARAMQEKNAVLPTASGISPKGQWVQHTLTSALNRAAGMVPRWQFKDSESLHFGGEGNDLIYFQSPLRGSFTVEGELSTYGWREARIMYATQWAGAQYTNEAADLGNLHSHWVGPKFAKKLDPIGEWCYAKLVVTPEKASYFVNEQLIHETLLSDNTDPWLAIYSFQQFAASTRFLRITGEPEIPAELLLSKRDDLQGWWADMYNDVMSGDNPTWKKDGEEIVGNKIVNQEGRHRESLLQYHRPMLEDGEISYDFFYVPQQTHIHPTLGRMVMMLAEDGVKIHWLTDAQYERGGLAPDNLFVEQDYRRGTAMPLKASDWNKISLKLKGDIVTLALNGDTIYERPLDSNNLRNFGFFRYAGDTDARVKNVVYRGNWPKTLPSLKDQELANTNPQLVNFKDGELPATFSWNFQGKQPAHLDLMGTVPTSKFSPVEGGLKIERGRGTVAAASSAGVQWNNVSVGGDFEVTLDYRNFQSSTRDTTYKIPRIELLLGLGGRFGHESQALSAVHRRNAESKMELAAVQGVRKDPSNMEWSSKTNPITIDGGRLRISRRSGVAHFQHGAVGTDDWKLIDRRPI